MSDLPIFVLNEHAITAASMAASIPAVLIDLAEVNGFCADFIWTGVPVGTLTVSGSNQMTNLSQFSVLTTQAAGGGAGSYLYNYPDMYFRYITVSYTAVSGSGTLDCYVSGKRN